MRRVYEIWQQYTYDKDGKVEFLICYRNSTDGQLKYYYPEIQLTERSTGG